MIDGRRFSYSGVFGAVLLTAMAVGLAHGFAMVKCPDEYWDDYARPSAKAGAPFVGEARNPWEGFLSKALSFPDLDELDRERIRRLYERRASKPVFISSRFELTPDGRQLLERLEAIADDGIDPEPYHLEELREGVAALDRWRTDDVSLKPLFRQVWAGVKRAGSFDECPVPVNFHRFLQEAQKIGEARPSARTLSRKLRRAYAELFEGAGRVDALLLADFMRMAREMRPFAFDVLVQETVLGARSMGSVLEELEPNSPHYGLLRRFFGKYRTLAAETVPLALPFNHTLRPGAAGPSVKPLQERLEQEGFYDGAINGVFDDATVAAVKSFQRAHMLKPDGVVGPRTRSQLSVPYMEKARMIAYSLELLRRSDTNRYRRFIRINIPQFVLEYHVEGSLRGVHRVVVGNTSRQNQTPTFTSTVERLVFNPKWYISERIRMELEGRLDPGKGYIELSSFYPSGGPRWAQLPGPHNPLGRVKFEFPNAYAVYVHDTPKKSLFKRVRRTFSHGCIRLEDALEFARTLLVDDGNSVSRDIDGFMKHRRQTYIRLNEPVPIVLEYVPVSTDGKGSIVFCGDPYRRLQKAVPEVPETLFTSPRDFDSPGKDTTGA